MSWGLTLDDGNAHSRCCFKTHEKLQFLLLILIQTSLFDSRTPEYQQAIHNLRKVPFSLLARDFGQFQSPCLAQTVTKSRCLRIEGLFIFPCNVLVFQEGIGISLIPAFPKGVGDGIVICQESTGTYPDVFIPDPLVLTDTKAKVR
jgi:hypothetical protein